VSTWQVFALHGKNILKKFYATPKSYAHMLVVHHSLVHGSCSHAHMIVALHGFQLKLGGHGWLALDILETTCN
jgi:hypothetical protein